MKIILLAVLFLIPSVTAAEEPRWGLVRYDLNVMEYVIPKCEHSKIKAITMKREGERLVVRLECEPVVGETNLPNPDLY